MYKNGNVKGAGDGLKQPKTLFPTSRKFTIARNQCIQSKLKNRENKNEQHFKQFGKAKTDSEITPIKFIQKSLKLSEESDLLELHKTLSRFPNESNYHQLIETACRRFFLLVWQKNRIQLKDLSLTLQNEIKKELSLVNQIQLLKVLNKSEQDNANKAIADYQETQIQLENVQLKHTEILSKKEILELKVDELNQLKNNLVLNVKDLKEEIKVKINCIKKLDNDLGDDKIVLIQLQADNKILKSKQTTQVLLIEEQQDIIVEVQHNLKNNEKELAKMKHIKDKVYANNKSIKAEMYKNRKLFKDNVQKMKALENQLSILTDSYQETINANQALKQHLEAAKNVWKIAEKIVKRAWSILQESAYLMLPALH